MSSSVWVEGAVAGAPEPGTRLRAAQAPPRSRPPPTELKEICELTGIDQSVLERAFSFRTVEAKQEKVSTTLNVAQVGEQRQTRCFGGRGGGVIALCQGTLEFYHRVIGDPLINS